MDCVVKTSGSVTYVRLIDGKIIAIDACKKAKVVSEYPRREIDDKLVLRHMRFITFRIIAFYVKVVVNELHIARRTKKMLRHRGR